MVTFSRKRNSVLLDYSLKVVAPQGLSTVRDLGVLHDSKLLFVSLESIATKASRLFGFIMRYAKDFAQVKTIKIIDCSFVRSSSEHASQIWLAKSTLSHLYFAA